MISLGNSKSLAILYTIWNRVATLYIEAFWDSRSVPIEPARPVGACPHPAMVSSLTCEHGVSLHPAASLRSLNGICGFGNISFTVP